MRLTGRDVLKTGVLLMALCGAGCATPWGSARSATEADSSQGHFAAGGTGVAPRRVPAAQPEGDEDCAAAQAIAQGSTRLVHQGRGSGRPPREDSSDTTNLAETRPGPTYAARGIPSPTPSPPAGAPTRRPGC